MSGAGFKKGVTGACYQGRGRGASSRGGAPSPPPPPPALLGAYSIRMLYGGFSGLTLLANLCLTQSALLLSVLWLQSMQEAMGAAQTSEVRGMGHGAWGTWATGTYSN